MRTLTESRVAMSPGSPYAAMSPGSPYAGESSPSKSAWSPSSGRWSADSSSFDNEEVIRSIHERITELHAKEEAMIAKIEDFNRIWAGKRKPYDLELDAIRSELAEEQENLKKANVVEHDAPGPECLSWVDTPQFNAACVIVVGLNILLIVLGFKYDVSTSLLDNLFLLWYIFELCVRLVYYQDQFFCGQFAEVGLNWLDLAIVAGSILFNWIIPHVTDLSADQTDVILGCLRTLRLLRVLKLARLLESDLSWAEGEWFQWIMTLVIAANAVLMAAELDVPSLAGLWDFLNMVLLIIYIFELMVNLKLQGKSFFCDSETVIWNYLDSIIVAGAIVDSCLTPGVELAESLINGRSETGTFRNKAFSNFSKLIRLMRLLRILRLVKLMRGIPPLYRLLNGVVDSLKAMQWVMVLTLMVLYGMAIFWTTVVGTNGGAGLLFEEEHKEVADAFGTIPKSLFSLFRMMNGDTDFAELVFSVGWGRVVYVAFMVTVGWAILAILTSVVSDNMIAASQETLEEDERQKQAEADYVTSRRLNAIFHEFDAEREGIITEDEWKEIIKEDSGFRHQLIEATGCTIDELKETFKDLSVFGESRMSRQRSRATTNKTAASRSESNGCWMSERFSAEDDDSERLLHYEKFIEFMRDKDKPADKKLLMSLGARLEFLETELCKAMKS